MKWLNGTKLKENICATVEKELQDKDIGGAEIIINQNGERVFHEVFGMKNGKEKMRFDGIYRIASMTKPVTACAVLKEVERGNIDLDDDVSNYLPDYEYSNFDIVKLVDGKEIVVGKNTKPMKVFHLLSHTSGLGADWIGVKAMENMPDEAKTSLENAAKYYSKTPLMFEPYTWERYSITAAFDVAARIVEIVSKKPYDQYLRDNIFAPLSMTDTTFSPNEEQWKRMVGVFCCDKDGNVIERRMVKGCVFEKLPPSYMCAGGGLASSAEDYSRFAEMLLNDGKDKDGNEIIREDLIRKMRSPAVDDSIMDQIHRWGLGVRVIVSKKDILPIGSFGWSGAYKTHFWVDPENRITAILMQNSSIPEDDRTKINFEKDVMRSF
ncbi:MAG: beta-lactamase family protein [Clostridia bacterium]|nr:beta-lactamase family protein [Clostridia bacterium]